MHEFVPEPRRVFSDAYDCDDDEEYDVYHFYPAQNVLVLQPAFPDYWEDETCSESTTSDHSVVTSPTYSVDPSFNFGDTVNDAGISSMGYSRFFRTGLWAQSSRITRRLDALIEQAVTGLQSIKRHFFARQTPPVYV